MIRYISVPLVLVTFLIRFFAIAPSQAHQVASCSLAIELSSSGHSFQITQLEAAIIDSQQIEANPDNLSSYASRGELLFDLGIGTMAIQDFLKVVELGADRSYYAKRVGDVFFYLNAYSEARSIYEVRNEFATSETRDQLYFMLARTQYMQGETLTAVSTLDTLISISPRFAPAYVERAYLLNELDSDVSLTIDWSSIREFNYELGQFYFEDALNHLIWENYDLSMIVVNRGIEASSNTSQDNLHNLYMIKGILHIQAGEYTNAIDALNHVISIDSNCATPYIVRATSYENLDHFDEAYSDLENARSIDNGNFEIYDGLARIANVRGHRQEATTFRDIHTEGLAEDSGQYFTFLGTLFVFLDMYDQSALEVAELNFSLAASLYPNFPDLYLGMSYLARAQNNIQQEFDALKTYSDLLAGDLPPLAQDRLEELDKLLAEQA